MSRIESKVAIADLRVCSWPVDSGKVSGSNIRSVGGMLYSSTTMRYMRSATSNFHCAVSAWPTSSMVSATRAAPYFLARIVFGSRVLRPSSRLIELMTVLPEQSFSAASMTLTSVESIMIGFCSTALYRRMTCFMSATPSRPT